MLSLSNVGNGEAAASYYEAADDYYTKDRCPSAWWGEAAAHLGLVGTVEPETFAALLDGRLPSGEQLHHAAAGRRGGTDATFSASKSVSLQALVGKDIRLLDAHRTAVERALVQAEKLAACRITEAGRTSSTRTGNLLVARFEHDLSRARDPQLHTHCVILNATRRADGAWRSLDNEALYRHKMLLGALYRAELARAVQALGYDVRLTHLDGRFELAHIDDAQVRAFSQRSMAIEAYLVDHGSERETTTAWDKQLAAVATRARKEAVDRVALQQDWRALSAEHSIDFTTPVSVSRPALTCEAAQAVLTEAIEHLGEREAVFSHADLLRRALESGVGTLTFNELGDSVEAAVRAGTLIRADGCYTTPAAQAREAEILALEARGRDAFAPIYAGERAALLAQLAGLTPEQKQAVEAVLRTRHAVMGIQGRAGVGKTTLLASATHLAQSCGYTVRGLAPSASAARELASTGMPAETIAAFAQREQPGLTPQTLLVLDEAGMTSAKQMHLVLMAAAQAGCRVLLVGDTAQLAAVEAGKPFAQLQAAGMSTARVSQIQRQRNARLKAAVEHAVSGEVTLAVDLLDKDIVQITSATERFARIADDYCALAPSVRAQTRVIAGTRLARSQINRRIRTRLALAEDSCFTLLTRKNLTEVERRSTLGYQVDDVLQADIDYPSLGLKRGDYARVVAHLEHRLLIERADGMQVLWQPALAARLSAFAPESLPLAVGERVRVTANDRARGLVNGDLATLVGFDASRRQLTLALDGGRQVTLDSAAPLMLDYGYCSTVHAAQGQTCERVFIEADCQSMTANRNTFYVAISRAREQAKIYTDDREILEQAMGRAFEKTSALDLETEHRLNPQSLSSQLEP